MPTIPPPINRNRRWPRRDDLAFSVRVNVMAHGTLVNLSEGGALLRLSRPHELGKQVTVAIEGPGKTVHVPARVVRSVPLAGETEPPPAASSEYHVAVEFLDFGAEMTGSVRRLMEQTVNPRSETRTESS